MRLTNFFYFLSGMIVAQAIENTIAVEATPFAKNVSLLKALLMKGRQREAPLAPILLP